MYVYFPITENRLRSLVRNYGTPEEATDSDDGAHDDIRAASVDGGARRWCPRQPLARLDRRGHQRPATRRLLRSVADYVAGKDFNPALSLEPHQVKALFAPAPETDGSGTSDTIRQLLNQ